MRIRLVEIKKSISEITFTLLDYVCKIFASTEDAFGFYHRVKRSYLSISKYVSLILINLPVVGHDNDVNVHLLGCRAEF